MNTQPYTYGRNGVDMPDLADEPAGTFTIHGRTFTTIKPKVVTTFTFQEGLDLVEVGDNGQILRRIRPVRYKSFYEWMTAAAVKHFGLTFPKSLVYRGPRGPRKDKGAKIC